jgi:hypothetical protein
MTSTLKSRAVMTAAVVLAATQALAESPAKPPSDPKAVSTSVEAPRAVREKQLRARLGLFGGVAMQKPQFELGAGYDFLPIASRLRLVGDLTVGLRSNEITLEPMVGLRLPFALNNAPKLEPYVAGLAGFNLTFMRGGTALSVPIRGAAGLHYQVLAGLGVGAELAVEAGPLVAPFSDVYAAIHFCAMAAWAL